MAAWGTKAENQTQVYEAADLKCSFEIDGQVIENQEFIKNIDLTDEIIITYKLGETGTKRLILKPDQIVVEIDHPGQFSEYLPLINSDDQFTEKSGSLEMRKNEVNITITHDAMNAQIQESTSEFENLKVYPYILNAQDKLSYQIKFSENL